jgi:hypothetical protein
MIVYVVFKTRPPYNTVPITEKYTGLSRKEAEAIVKIYRNKHQIESAWAEE